MQLNTRHFGTIEIDERGIVEFPDGIPGFNNVKRYVLLGSENEESMFRWLQSVDRSDLAFAVVDPFLIKKDYDIELSDEVTEKLDIRSIEDVAVYSIVVVPEDTSKISMNLKAPVVINVRKNKGAQVVLDTDRYGVRHYILEELQGREDAVNAGTYKEKGSIHCNK